MGTRTSSAKTAGLVALIAVVVGVIGFVAAGAIAEPAVEPSTPAGDPAGSANTIAHLAISTDAAGVAKGAETSIAASGGMSRAGEAAAGADDATVAAPVATPDEGGTATANLASTGASAVGTSIADAKSQGRSAAGSGNANH